MVEQYPQMLKRSPRYRISVTRSSFCIFQYPLYRRFGGLFNETRRWYRTEQRTGTAACPRNGTLYETPGEAPAWRRARATRARPRQLRQPGQINLRETFHRQATASGAARGVRHGDQDLEWIVGRAAVGGSRARGGRHRARVPTSGARCRGRAAIVGMRCHQLVPPRGYISRVDARIAGERSADAEAVDLNAAGYCRLKSTPARAQRKRRR